MIGGIAAAVAAGLAPPSTNRRCINACGYNTRAIHSPGTGIVSRRRHHPNRGNHPNPAKRRGARRHRVIRTFLSFSLELEITGQSPWHKAPAATSNDPSGGSPPPRLLPKLAHRPRRGGGKIAAGELGHPPPGPRPKTGSGPHPRWSPPAATRARPDPEYRRSQIWQTASCPPRRPLRHPQGMPPPLTSVKDPGCLRSR